MSKNKSESHRNQWTNQQIWSKKDKEERRHIDIIGEEEESKFSNVKQG